MSATELDAAGVVSQNYFVTEEDHPENGSVLGFWIYLMSDAFIFAVLFVSNAVLGANYAAGPSGKDVLDLGGLAANTAMLLLSSVTYGFAMLEMRKSRKNTTLAWLAIAGLFAAAFIGLEIHEFIDMVSMGAGPDRSAFLSSFFILVGTHGTHVTFGIIWLITLMVQVSRYGLTADNCRRLTCLSLFWHFLDLVWVGVFSFVYLVGVLR